VLALFAELLHHQSEAAYRPTSTTTALWSAVVMDYHRGWMEKREVEGDVWSDVSPHLVALLVDHAVVGPSAEAVELRASELARLRATVVKATERLVAAVNDGWERVQRRADLLQLHAVNAAFFSHLSRLPLARLPQFSASWTYFSASLLQRAQEAARKEGARAPRPVFFAAVEAALRLLPYPLIKGAELGPDYYAYPSLLGVRVPYPPTAGSSEHVVVLVGGAQMVERMGRKLHLPGSAELAAARSERGTAGYRQRLRVEGVEGGGAAGGGRGVAEVGGKGDSGVGPPARSCRWRGAQKSGRAAGRASLPSSAARPSATPAAFAARHE
jgi:hypothetical protein